MPGRGQPWKGVGFGNPDRIGTGAIADGSITEADLDSNVTSKLNAGGHTIQDEGSPLTDRPTLDFVGAGVTATDDSENTKTVVTIPGGGGLTRELVSNPDTDMWLYDEFFYPAPTTGLDQHYEKTGTFSAPTNVLHGQVQFQTTASTNAITRINTCGAGLLAMDPTKNFRIVWRARKVTSDANIAVLLGAYRDQGSKPGGAFPFSSPQPDYVFFRADGTGNWFAQTHDGTTPTSTDTAVATDTLFHTFEIRSDPSGPNIEYLIDGAIVATHTTNLPNNNVAIFAGVQTGTTSSKSIVVDSFFMYQDR